MSPNEVIPSLRKEKLSKGIPFMVNTHNGHYYEYPDGRLVEIQLLSDGDGYSWIDEVRTLTIEEEQSVRNEIGLPRLEL